MFQKIFQTKLVNVECQCIFVKIFQFPNVYVYVHVNVALLYFILLYFSVTKLKCK